MSILDKDGDGVVNRSELDSHADTTVGGANTVILARTNHEVKITPFSQEYEAMEKVPIATIGTVFDCPVFS